MSNKFTRDSVSSSTWFLRQQRDPDADDLTPSAVCKLEGCSRPLYRITENAVWRLCQEHYERRLLKQQRKLQSPDTLFCKFCCKVITSPHNSTYCDRDCADADRRVIDDTHTVKVLSYSWWRNIETLLRFLLFTSTLTNQTAIKEVNSPPFAEIMHITPSPLKTKDQ